MQAFFFFFFFNVQLARTWLNRNNGSKHTQGLACMLGCNKALCGKKMQRTKDKQLFYVFCCCCCCCCLFLFGVCVCVCVCVCVVVVVVVAHADAAVVVVVTVVFTVNKKLVTSF